jgi:3-deoxy-manno-octulosonate cytidylyltransferase (CMP-KDO synthetase)
MMKNNTSNFLGVIPARFNSSRLMGKPLKIIGDKPMIQHVYEKAKIVLENVVVATDDDKIFKCVESFKGNVILTKKTHKNGTSRCLEAVNNWNKKVNKDYKYIINIQGDEPLLSKDHLNKLIICFNDTDTNFATVGLEVSDQDELGDGKVYLVKDINNFALYFSRNKIPFVRNHKNENKELKNKYYQHIGIYGYKLETLKEFCDLGTSSLEDSEKLEQLRWLENGGKIKVGVTKQRSHPVDTEEDLNIVREIFAKNHH